ncbi:MAG: hypothetical protein KC464_09420, partial [Myxococcales bacterium]|nr:hypothetical protein [Myxococcales bacterium]
ATTASDDGPADVTGAGVTPRAYHLELAIDPEATGFTGTVTIDVDVAVRTRTIWLDARELEISSVRVVRPGAAGAPDEQLEATEATGAPTGKVGITLARPLPPGPARVELRFAGLYRLDDGLFAQTYRAHTYAFSDFEPLDARRAFPCFDEPRFKTPWTVSLVVPHGLVALSNTAAETTTRLDRDLDRVDFATTPPLPSYLVAVAVGPFDLVDVDGGPVPMRLVVPQGRRAAAERARVIAPQIVAAAAELLDRRVPFDKLDFIAVPRFGGAMENPGLITVSAGILLDATDDAAERRLALVIAHETSHLWFGDWMTLEDWRDLWIQEGVASWMADEVLARWRPGWHTRRGELKSRGEAMREDALPDAHPLRPDELDGPRALFDVLTYQKAAAVLHMFEAWVGEDAFLDGLRGLLDDRPWGHATTTDLVAALASAAGDGDRVDATRAAVTSFLARPGIPVIEAELQCGGEARVRLHLREPGWAVPACVRWGDGAGTHQACAVV